jgi:hypothetical protein
MHDSAKAAYEREASAKRLDDAMVVIIAALSAGALFAILDASPLLPMLDPNVFLSMALSP